MAFTYKLVRERCRVGVSPERKASLEIVYALSERLPIGTRQKLVPGLTKALANHNLQLLALDLFDEFVRLHLPLEAPAKVVETSFQKILHELETSESALKIPRTAEDQLRRYLSESSR
ncbi:MAG: hypothetical protein A2Z21_06195 [Candidatus Fraserbacteria bacterium RBG_16_55_9]|uniref:Uncharacterized protein n=1 Tax=Fraserbacteria sp. (strain RBG_16_55_9) TaxID=1817864 RepID=A0A1F5UZG3_FRAXR|nr:MAG: hypothetical protein A2Z21_06195 [Candidatus Fraserbacteria bacterium RBG_16_55_9]